MNEFFKTNKESILWTVMTFCIIATILICIGAVVYSSFLILLWVVIIFPAVILFANLAVTEQNVRKY